MTETKVNAVKPESKHANKWLQRLLDSPHAIVLIFVLSMLESIIIPIPLELILIPFMVLERDRVWLIATATLAGCLVGATIGYLFGAWMFDSVGQWLLEWLSYEAQFETFAAQFENNGFWAIVAVGVTPIPFQVAMLTAGASDYGYGLFMLAALLARGIRYYGLALLVVWLGQPALTLWQRHSKTLGFTLLALILVGLGVGFYL